ncbi:hypothetical protein [Streptomyces sp. CS62]
MLPRPGMSEGVRTQEAMAVVGSVASTRMTPVTVPCSGHWT